MRKFMGPQWEQCLPVVQENNTWHRFQASAKPCLDAHEEFPALTYYVFNIKLVMKIESYGLDPLAGIFPKEVVRQSL